MSMTTTAAMPPRFKSREEILYSPELTAFQKGRELAAWDASHPPVPELPTPLTATERLRLRNIEDVLKKLAADFETLESRQTEYGETLPADREAFRALQKSTLPNASDDLLLKELLAEKRIQKKLNFLANIAPQRELMERQLIGLFGNLNHCITRFTVQQFYVSGSRPALTIRTCLLFLEQFLKQ